MDSGDVAGGALPRWGSGEGIATLPLALPEDTGERLAAVAAALGVRAETVLLAVHAKVLAAVTGEETVAAGYAGAVRELVVAEGSWAQLVAAVAAGAGTTPADTRTEAWTALTVHEEPAEPAGAELIRVGFTGLGTGPACVLRYRADVIGHGQAERFAGYHARALDKLLSDVHAVQHTESLVSQAELRLQIHEFAGATTPDPDRPPHELVEELARRHPDRVALLYGEVSWTYRELNRRANQVAWWLLDSGLRPEDRVAVIADRNPEWASAVLGTLKAGGAYLPVEPNFPADRIRTMLTQSNCGLVLADRNAPEIDSVPAESVLLLGEERGPSRDADPGVEVTGDQLAYVYFTSGSTGKPKGAMCEHAGMLNHLWAKIEDLGIGEGSVVAQVAPQCFDISLWQLMSAWLVGGTTAIIGQEEIHDTGEFVDALRRYRVDVLQVVPSYLEVLLAHLEDTAAAPPALRCVSVTGEPLKAALVNRWFARFPSVPLVNAYGLTETSDDTNHAVLRAPLATGRVPVGRPVRNVRIYLVDEQLRPVPLGAPGEIVFAGVCVGRGYINDPVRTNRAYLADPYFPGQRMYRSGDYGRWLPDGNLEFLGRRDAQVKIRGFRVELGEVENKMSTVEGVQDCAVVVLAGADQVDRLVGFYSAPETVTPERVRERIAMLLPSYMIPSNLHRRERLPLTENGKIDKKRLRELAAELVGPEGDEPAGDRLTGPELRLQQAWCELFGLAPSYVHRQANFFDLGGTSLLAIRLAIKLDRSVTLQDVTETPVLADLAKVLERRQAPA
ncbi:non-ribosomal peptide synthetase [Amycolatopsis aidingensis]|uniref:non-ribosomal peptide synthetase n=1 Tax=Amycolatopsis aidingensis TaxID=2842453 RepID=UPI001C0B2AE8|nr:non-ribosomal peptide synthetase [Amycolatopsis aidingensis]